MPQKPSKTTPKQILQELEDELRAHLDENPNPWLPSNFEITLESADFQYLMSNFVDASTKQPLPIDSKFFALKLGNYIVGICQEEAPEPN